MDYRKLWTIRNSQRSRCSNHQQLHDFIINSDIDVLHHILINVGVNDIDRGNAEQVFNDIKKNVALIKSKYPGIKIVLCELTPRRDQKDNQVIECNRLINEYALSEDNIFVANHSNLRAGNYLEDNKHVAKRHINVFAVNLKKALCAAYGKVYTGRVQSKPEIRTIRPDSFGSRGNQHASIQTRLMNLANQNNMAMLRRKLTTSLNRK